MLEIHIDPLGGIAGDMFVAALIDLRPDLEQGLLQALAGMSLLEGVDCAFSKYDDGVLNGRRFTVGLRTGNEKTNPENAHGHLHDHAGTQGHNHRAWKTIRSALQEAPLSEAARHHAIGIFTCLAEAEAAVHATTPDAVTFHEVGAWDSIADIVATAWLVAELKAERWTVGPLPLGGGRIKTAHGALPVPAPATALLLEGFQTIDDGIGGERVTPTGAAIIRYLCDPHTQSKNVRRLTGSAHGFGTRSLPGISNCVRLLSFETTERALPATNRIVVLECEIDDQTSEDLALAIDRLRALDGVLDVIQASVTGKKGRLMTHLRVLVTENAESIAVASIFDETTTLGLRRSEVGRYVLSRQEVMTDVDDRTVRLKLADRPSGRTAKLEADDLNAMAGARNRKDLRRRTEAQFEQKRKD